MDRKGGKVDNDWMKVDLSIMASKRSDNTNIPLPTPRLNNHGPSPCPGAGASPGPGADRSPL